MFITAPVAKHLNDHARSMTETTKSATERNVVATTSLVTSLEKKFLKISRGRATTGPSGNSKAPLPEHSLLSFGAHRRLILEQPHSRQRGCLQIGG